MASPTTSTNSKSRSTLAAARRPRPTPDDLIVLYFATAVAVQDALRRLKTLGYSPVAPQNPYWQTRVRGFTLVDPDGWRVILVEPADERPAYAHDNESNDEEVCDE
jgi:hypothetical protein